MIARESPHVQASFTTRRQLIATAALAFGGLSAGAKVWGQAPQQPTKEAPCTPTNAMRTSLHQEGIIKASPQRIYEAAFGFQAIRGVQRPSC